MGSELHKPSCRGRAFVKSKTLQIEIKGCSKRADSLNKFGDVIRWPHLQIMINTWTVASSPHDFCVRIDGNRSDPDFRDVRN